MKKKIIVAPHFAQDHHLQITFSSLSLKGSSAHGLSYYYRTDLVCFCLRKARQTTTPNQTAAMRDYF